MADNTTTSNQAEAMLHAQDYLRILKSRWAEAFFVFLLVFVSCAVITNLMTPTYVSSMRIEIKQPGEQIDVTAKGSGISPLKLDASMGSYTATQFEVLVSQRNLRHVAEKLSLPKEWGTTLDGAAMMLKNCIKIEPVEGTAMTDIIVAHSNAQTACEICAQVTASYREIRDREETQKIQDAIADRKDVLEQSAAKLDRKAENVRYHIANSKYLAGMWNSYSGQPESSGGEKQRLYTLRSSQTALKNELSRVNVHINQLNELKDDALLNYVVSSELLSAESFASDRVRQLHRKMLDEEDERGQRLLAGYGEKHPVVLRLDEQHARTQKQLFDGLADMRDAMEHHRKLKQDELVALEKDIVEAEAELREQQLEERTVLQAHEEYKKANEIHSDLEHKHEQDRMRLSARRAIVDVYSEPVKAGAPSSPNTKLNLIVGAVVGIITGIVVAFIYNYFDTSVKSLEDAERHLALPVLGVIPQDAGLLALQGGNSPDAEAYRILRTNIELKKSLFKARTFAIVSANAGEGKTTTLSNLAYVYAAAGYSTLMIDADLRRPRLARYAEMEDAVGLSNYLTSDMPLKDAVFRTNVPNLYLMPSGPQPVDPSGVLGSYRMDQLLNETSRRFDIVFFDSPPVLGVSDASLLVSKVDATLIVLQPRKMPLKALLRTKSIINNVGGQIMGLVMNNVDISADTQYQYYTTYYSYYTSDNPQDESLDAKLKQSKRSESKKVEKKSVAKNTTPVQTAESDDDLY